MGDRTFQQATIWQCPEDLARAVAEILGEYSNDYVDTATVLGIGSAYYMEEGSLGTAEETARALVELGAAIVAETSEDPKYEYLGEHYVVLGGEITSMPCDSDGEDLVFARYLDQILADEGSARTSGSHASSRSLRWPGGQRCVRRRGQGRRGRSCCRLRPHRSQIAV
jgi:hypothetical protein